MSYTHESASKDEFWAAVEGARAVHGTHWTLGDGHLPMVINVRGHEIKTVK